jgi:two-component system LytT family response regulator
VTPVRALIVDDEEPARELLRAFLADWPEVEVVGEAGDGPGAVALVRRLRPDLVFLDVQMPLMSGLDVVGALAPEETPLVVFVTAYDQYALKAFEVSACDYLLKPFDAPRFATTVRRVLGREHPERAMRAALRALAAHVGGGAAEAPVVVKVDGRHLFLTADEIEWVEAAGKDVRLHLVAREGQRELLVREPISSLERRLDRERFVRVHRSAIVNRARIREMQPWFKGDWVVVLRGGARIVSGRTYRGELRRLLGL